MENKFLKFFIDKKNDVDNFTHLFNISAAISYFPKLTSQIIEKFIDYENNDDIFDILEFFDDNLINDGELRKPLVCSLIYAEKYSKEILKNILRTYITNSTYQDEIKEQVLKTYDKENYKLASFLLYDYYIYLETGEYKGLSTKVS